MVWRKLSRYVRSLEESGDMLRIPDPVDVELEAVDFVESHISEQGLSGEDEVLAYGIVEMEVGNSVF